MCLLSKYINARKWVKVAKRIQANQGKYFTDVQIISTRKCTSCVVQIMQVRGRSIGNCVAKIYFYLNESYLNLFSNCVM
jgi:hypothetical protein